MSRISTKSAFLEERLALLNEHYASERPKGNYFYHPLHIDCHSATPVVDGLEMLQFSSYSYLALLDHPQIRDAAQRAISEFGTGSHGARLLAGTTPLHQALETRISGFTGTEDAVVFSSGYVANIAVITTLADRGRVVVSDMLNHASIVDGCVLSWAHHLRFRHNDMRSLENCLRRAGAAGALVVTDAVFSMDGDIADLPAISKLCRRYGAALMVDEAHSLGVLGKYGRGIEEHFGMDSGTIDIKMGTLSKAIPAVGGYIAGSRELVTALRHNSRPYIFSSALPPVMAAAALKSLEVIDNEPERVTKLQKNVEIYRQGLAALGFNVLGEGTPIAPVICPSEEKTFEMTRGCIARGLLVLPIVFPAVRRKTPRLRTIVTAAHAQEHIQRALSILEETGLATGVLSRSPQRRNSRESADRSEVQGGNSTKGKTQGKRKES